MAVHVTVAIKYLCQIRVLRALLRYMVYGHVLVKRSDKLLGLLIKGKHTLARGIELDILCRE